MKDKIHIKIDCYEDDAVKRQFSSGKFGYGYYGKLIIDGDTFQVSLNVVKIG
jgi:hypothetical protein